MPQQAKLDWYQVINCLRQKQEVSVGCRLCFARCDPFFWLRTAKHAHPTAVEVFVFSKKCPSLEVQLLLS